MYHTILKEEARLDMLDAYLFYERQQIGLGERFLSELESRFTALTEHPEYFSFIDDKKILRDVTINHFPFVIVYEISDSVVTIYAILNTNKKPKDNYRK